MIISNHIFMNLAVFFNSRRFFGMDSFDSKQTHWLTAEEKKAIERKVVARFSCGNVRLQQGKYLNQEDIDARFERIRRRAILNND